VPKSRTTPDADVLNNNMTPEADIRDEDQAAEAGEAIKEPTPMGQEVPQVVDDASKIGAKRLRRPLLGDAITAFTGGMSVSFGAVAMVTAAAAMGGGIDSPSAALLVGSLVFPVGFLILLVGKTELFTENFLLPVAAVLKGRGNLHQLGSLWGTTLAFNLLGALVFALLISRNHVMSPGPAEEMIALATHSVNYSLWTAFIKALFAGWLMTTLTWLLVAAVGFGPRIAVIWAIGSLIVLGQFNHVIISAAEIFIAMFLGADITFGDWVTRNFLPALGGNIFGGLVFETMLQYIQSRYHDPEEEAS
jgi:formate/nitrite transporter FocA (FNT family)